MRHQEFKLRQKLITYQNLTEDTKKEIARLAKDGANRKALTILFGISYSKINAIREVY